MKKMLTTIAAVAVMGMAGIASASTYSFEDMIDNWGLLGSDAAYIGQNNPLSYTHNINDSVNFAAGDMVTEAFLELDFTNDSSDDFGSIIWGLIKWDNREFASYVYDGHNFVSLGEVDNGQYQNVVDIDWLNDNGLLDVKISVSNPLGTATAWLDHSKLYGTAETAPVPEPSTMLMLGAGLLGLGLYGRRRIQK